MYGESSNGSSNGSSNRSSDTSNGNSDGNTLNVRNSKFVRNPRLYPNHTKYPVKYAKYPVRYCVDTEYGNHKKSVDEVVFVYDV